MTLFRTCFPFQLVASLLLEYLHPSMFYRRLSSQLSLELEAFCHEWIVYIFCLCPVAPVEADKGDCSAKICQVGTSNTPELLFCSEVMPDVCAPHESRCSASDDESRVKKIVRDKNR